VLLLSERPKFLLDAAGKAGNLISRSIGDLRKQSRRSWAGVERAAFVGRRVRPRAAADSGRARLPELGGPVRARHRARNARHAVRDRAPWAEAETLDSLSPGGHCPQGRQGIVYRKERNVKRNIRGGTKSVPPPVYLDRSAIFELRHGMYLRHRRFVIVLAH